MANGNVNVSVKVADLIKMIEKLIDQAKADHAKALEAFKNEEVSYKNAFEQWRDKAASEVAKAAEQIKKGNCRSLSVRWRGNAQLNLTLPAQPEAPTKPSGPYISEMQRDVKLLKMASEETIRITAHSNFARYF